MERISAKEIGLRCRKYRNALGWSQHDLATKVGTVHQNIAKYEKEGINNFDMIQRLSEALGYDLLINENDTEGNLGEIGEEILAVIIKNSGDIEYDSLVSDENGLFYGLPEDRLVHELIKLLNMGLIVREQYTDMREEKRDSVFVTAKGIIALKHVKPSVVENAYNLESYEQRCKEYDNYSDNIDSMKDEESVAFLANQLKKKDGFRLNFIEYIQSKYLGYSCVIDNNVSGKNIYIDILTCILKGLSVKQLAVIDSGTDYYYTLSDNIIRNEIISDTVVEDIDLVFDTMRPDSDDYYDRKNKCLTKLAEELYPEKAETFRLAAAIYAAGDYVDRYNCERDNISEEISRRRGMSKSSNPEDLFSNEEIISFIKENIKKAETKDEKETDVLLAKIIRKDPSVLEYFRFSTRWINEGIAELICDLYNLPKVEVKKEDGKIAYEYVPIVNSKKVIKDDKDRNEEYLQKDLEEFPLSNFYEFL